MRASHQRIDKAFALPTRGTIDRSPGHPWSSSARRVRESTAGGAALGAFLRSRRARLSPGQVGITALPGTRRVPGLRREELAVLTGVSVDYYSRLEQGRQRNVSGAVLDALAGALRLDRVEHAHLHSLAAAAARRVSVGRSSAQVPDQGLLRLVDALDPLPAVLVGHRGDVLARNAALSSLLGRSLQPGTSLLRYLLQDPVARERIVSWEEFAAATLAFLRRELGRCRDDHGLAALVDELRGSEEQVARWWDEHRVRDGSPLQVRVRHPDAGILTFDLQLISIHEPDQQLLVLTAEPGSATARFLPLLRGPDEPVPVSC